MSAKALNVEWHTTESDEEWEQACSMALPLSHTTARFIPWEVILVLVVLVSAGGRWYQNRSRVRQTESELAAAAQRDLAMAAPVGTLENKAAAYQTPVEARRFELHADQAIAYVNTGTQRQTLFYRRMETGWQQTAPNPALWGPAHTLATDSFIYHYQEKDAEVVTAVAPQVEAAYAQMRAGLGLDDLPTRSKTVVNVSLLHNPGDSRLLLKLDGPAQPGDRTRMPRTHHEIIVASPARYAAPAGVTDADLLAQSLLLPLALQVTSEAVRAYQLEWPEPEETRIAQALVLWQVWNLDVPLAGWREEVVGWRLHDLEKMERDQIPALPARYAELCAAHRLWLESPRELGIPLTCAKLDQEPMYWAMMKVPSLQADPLLSPLFRRTQTREGEQYWIDWYGDVVTLATLLEFVIDEYGRETLPTFLKEVVRHRSLNTFTLQVFGVSPGEFEARWQDYLRQHYPAP